MSIFEEVKDHISARAVAEGYGLKINRNGMACCPFHKDKHPSMKIDDRHYHCFGCGAHGDAVGYVAQLYGLSQYDAACKIVADFHLLIKTEKTVTQEEKDKYQLICQQRKYSEAVKKRFAVWINEAIDQLKECEYLIVKVKDYYLNTNGNILAVTNGFAYLLHQEPKIGYWLDILCTGEENDKQKLFLVEGKEVKRIAANVKRVADEILGRNRQNVG